MSRLPFPADTITGTFGSMSEFRRKNGLQPHSGVDFAPKGSNRGKTPIPAVGNGTVRFVQFSKVLGWVLVHTIWDVKKKKAAFVGYSHLSCKTHGINCKGGHDASQALDLKAGDKVKEGQTIGIMGSTGSASSGVHLHLTMSWTEKGIFGVTAQKFDFIEWLATQQTEKKQTNPKAEKVVLPQKVETIYACPHCKKELK
jgi:murein DD-endopeptidase MepM/ murein hydrolase activator NlpD